MGHNRAGDRRRSRLKRRQRHEARLIQKAQQTLRGQEKQPESKESAPTS